MNFTSVTCALRAAPGARTTKKRASVLPFHILLRRAEFERARLSVLDTGALQQSLGLSWPASLNRLSLGSGTLRSATEASA